MTNETIITVNNVCKSFGKTKILEDISLEVKKGEIFGLLGPSGCGKTTTIKIIAGVLKATSGEVTIIGQKVPSLEIMGKTGYMAQADAVYNNLTGRENLEFFGKINLLKKKEITKKMKNFPLEAGYLEKNNDGFLIKKPVIDTSIINAIENQSGSKFLKILLY